MNESDKIHSEVTGKDYYPSKCIRLVNIRQCCTYMQLGLKPLDIYPSIDFKTNSPVLVMIFDREESKPAYDRWCESDNLWEELQNEKH